MYPVLSMRQPQATFLVDDIKTIETRTWKTKYQGPLLIHASGKWDKYAKRDLHNIVKSNIVSPFKIAARKTNGSLYYTGGIIGIVKLVWVSKLDNLYEFELLLDNHLCAPAENYYPDNKPIYNWLITEPNRFPKPIPAKGKLNLWYPDDELWKEIELQLPKGA